MTDDVYTMYGVELSLYSGKSRAYLRFKGIPFVEKAPNLLTYYWTIRRQTGDAVVPVVVTPQGEWIQDTSTIIDRLEARYPEPSIVPNDPVRAFASYLLEMWGDEFWLPAAMHYRWSYPENRPLFVRDAGSAFFPRFPASFQTFAAGNAAKYFSGWLPQLGVNPRQVPLLERWTMHHLDVLDQHFAATPFLFGTRPSLGDFGLMGPIYAHLGRDPWPKRNLIEPRRNLHAWVKRMQQPGSSRDEFETGSVSETLTPVFRSVFDEMVPFLASVLGETRRVLTNVSKGATIPRMLQPVTYPLLDGEYRRNATPYLLWMVQRTLDWYRTQSESDSARIRKWLESLGGDGLFTLNIPRLRRVGLRVAVDHFS